MALFSFHPALLPGHIRRKLNAFLDTPVITAGKKKRPAAGLSAVQSDVFSALRNLGYRATDARAAVRGLSGSFDSMFWTALNRVRRK